MSKMCLIFSWFTKKILKEWFNAIMIVMITHELVVVVSISGMFMIFFMKNDGCYMIGA